MKKILALLLCLTMVLGMFPAAFAEEGIELAGDESFNDSGIEEVAGDDALGVPENADPITNDTEAANLSDTSVGADALIGPQTEEDAAAPDEAETSDELAKDNIPNDADEAEILIPGSIRDDDTFEAVIVSGSWRNLTWTLDSSGTLTISGSEPMKDFGDNSTDAWRSYSDSIKQIVIKDDVTSIGSYAFSGCSSLTSVTIPDSVTSIGQYAFSGCSSLTSVTIPDGVTSIWQQAFLGCSSLTSVHINSLAAWCDISFDPYANPLYYAHNLYLNDVLVENLVIPEGRLTIKDYTFSGCSSLTSVTIPDSVTSIGSSAFSGCSSLTCVTIPEGVNSIGGSAFSGCTGLESIEIPPTVKTIGKDAFYWCYSLDQVRIRDVGAWCEIEFGDYLFFYSGKCALYVNDEYIDHLVIPGSVNRINAWAFWGCDSILSVTIEEGVESIGERAFSYCSNLKHVEIPASLKAFGYCSYLGCFEDCPLTSAGPVGSHSSIEFAWEDEIPAYAFYRADGLKSVLIPGTIGSIGDYAFCGCRNLECATIQEGVNRIGDYAFAENYNLQTIVFPRTLNRIGSSAFYYCNKLSDIYYNGNDQYWNQVVKDDAFLQVEIHYEKTDPIVIEQHFPDPVFQEYIRRFDEDKNGKLTEGERAGVRTIDVSRLGIGTLEGIEYFPQLTELICGNNNLTALDVSVLPNLTSLHCDFNQLTSLDVSQNPKLKYLNCDYNQLETLNFGGTDQLIELSCSGNQLSDLQLTAFSNLKKLYCGWNQITGLDLSQNSALINLFVNNNSLETLDLSGNPVLLCLWCWGNKIETLDVSGCRQLSGSVLSGNIEKYRDSITYYWYGWFYSFGIDATDLSVDYDTRLIVASGSWGNLTWTLDSSGTLTISGSGPMKDFGDNSTDAWRSYADSIKQIVIEDGVTSIGNQAFRDCSSLTSVTIPDSVTSIGSEAFSGCTSLTSVTIPDGVTSIGSYAFWGCSSLTSVTIPDSVTSIDNGAFYGCSSLTSVTIPDGVTSIGEWAFSYCSSLTSVTIPASVTSIGGSAFYGCSSLTSAGPINSGCNIEFGWTTEIPDFAFYGCSGLTSVTIPSSVTSIGNGSFSACGSLTEILVNPANSSYCDRDGVLFSKNMTTIVQFPAGREGAYEIPEGVTSIGGSAFLGCSGLTSVTIPEGVTSIEDNAFCVCSSLTSVTIPDSVTSIGVSAFRGCTSLTSVTIPDSVTSIDAWAFRECRSLTSVTIPEGVTSIGDDAFYGCGSLKDVYFGGTKEAWDAITVGNNNTPLTNATIHYESSPVITYTVTFDANGGSGVPGAQTKTQGVNLTLSSAKPTRASTSAGSYTVTLNANGGSVSPASLSAARTTSYTFKNWNTATNGSGTSYNPGATYTADTSVTLYAQWDSTTTTAAVELPTPTREGYSFKGWAANSTAASGGTGRYTPNGNETLYAIWEKNSPTVQAGISFDSVNANPGAEISVPVRLVNNPGVIAVEFELSYNSELLEWIGVEPGEYGALGDYELAVGQPIAWFAADERTDVNTSGVFATLTFRVSENAGDGETVITANIDEDNLFNAALENVAFGVIPGTVTIESHVPGDTNGDGKVNNKDYMVLRRYIKYKDIAVVEAALDINGDGKVNNKDYMALRRYIKYKDIVIQ